MNIREFAAELRELLLSKMTEVNDIKIERCLKNNSIALTGLIFSEETSNVCPTIYADGYFKQHNVGRSMESIVTEIIQEYRRARLHPQIDMNFIRDWEKVKSMIAYKLINTAQNHELLQKIPHKEILDLSMVFYIAVEDVGGSILIYNNHCKMWGIEPEELVTAAQANTPRLHPLYFKPIMEVMSEMLGDAAEEIPDDVKMYILSNEKKVFGAVAMIYPDSMKNIADKWESDLYVLPSSTHEVLVLPAKENNVLQLKSMVEEVNDNCVNAEEILGYNVYYYDREKEELSIAS